MTAMQDTNDDRVGAAASETTKARSPLRRFGPLVGLAAMIAAAFALGLDEYISFETLRANSERLQDFVAQSFVVAALAYVALYAIVVAASLPGGAVLTMTGGFLFGVFAGTAFAVVGATIGATGIFLIAKTALGDTLREKAGGAVSRMAEGFRKDAFSYLLFLRLVPAFPFFVVNLAPAFLGVGLRTYVTATFVGIIPGAFVFASVGAGFESVIAQGGELSASGVLTPQVITALVGLAVLALIPVIVRRVREGKGRG
ncbi:TVP38/TMEM64 family protein [Salinarimonas ramus]|uniref:TVP38/TMEM64 family membrane protein n=1 Tax=Salinarimonas ramus TaxID=690164 RepID=A0A917V4K1_9HYPH|nr:TVP38/TMEM64 family protein [Salinarimonas ramus]GGK36363.1 TVP38/TMEM64 family protein [Salinarimonas ramus]